MSNPYESPTGETSFQPLAGQPTPPHQDPGMVKQVRIVAVLMMVQGSLDTLVGLGLGAGAIFVAMTGDQFFQGPQVQPGNAPVPNWMPMMMVGIYALMSALMILVGGLTVFAGIRSWNFKGRVVSIIALCSGMLTILFCYCLPTSLALLVYGLIVYLNPSVAAAFEMGKQGYTGEQILKAFRPPQPEYH